MDVFYEESAVNTRAGKDVKLYTVFNVLSYVFGIFSVLVVFSIVFGLVLPLLSGAGLPDDGKGMLFFLLFLFVLFVVPWFCFHKLKRTLNVSYDYTFVSGELRISKVFNRDKRKFLWRIEADDVLKIGDADNPSFERLRSDPTNKLTYCTPNAEPTKGKFFMYIHTGGAQKRLFLLECKEELLVNMLKYLKRGILESDYVMQEKKQK